MANFDNSLKILTSHRKSLFRYGGALVLLSVAWVFLSSLMLFLAFGSAGPNYVETMWGDVLANLSEAQIVSYVLLGGILACVAFALSVVSVPMIIDRDADAVTAMRASLRVALEADLPVMIVWGALCVVLIGVGFVSPLVGMVVVFPILGHAYLVCVPRPSVMSQSPRRGNT